jgi:hypothetical protein
MTLIDHFQVGWMGPVSVLEFMLLAVWAVGLFLGYKQTFKNRAAGAAGEPHSRSAPAPPGSAT